MGCVQSLDASLVPYTVVEWQRAFAGDWRTAHPEEFRARVWSHGFPQGFRATAYTTLLLAEAQVPLTEAVEAVAIDPEQAILIERDAHRLAVARADLFDQMSPDDAFTACLTAFERVRPKNYTGYWGSITRTLLTCHSVPDCVRTLIALHDTPRPEICTDVFRNNAQGITMTDVLDELIGVAYPQLASRMRREQVSVALLCGASLWFLTAFTSATSLSYECRRRIFDVYVLEGDTALYRVALALLTPFGAGGDPTQELTEQLTKNLDWMTQFSEEELLSAASHVTSEMVARVLEQHQRPFPCLTRSDA
jgi:hypothetical protein